MRVPPDALDVEVTFSSTALVALRIGIRESGLDPSHFSWPPATDPNRSPYRGLKPLEAEDTGIFFGRDGQIGRALDRLRGLRDGPAPRCMVILGASGAGKSSFLRAGLFPRLSRDRLRWLPLPVVRPLRAAITGEMGLIASLEKAVAGQRPARTRADVRQVVGKGPEAVAALLAELALEARPEAPAGTVSASVVPPTVVLPIDQGEELFLIDGGVEQGDLLALVGTLLVMEAPGLVVLFTIRSDYYEKLQLARALEGIRQVTFSLPPIARGAYSEVIRGPARRMTEGGRKLEIDDRLVDKLLEDMEGEAKDALPLLGFTLERLYLEYGGDGHLRLEEYETMDAIGTSIEAAVKRALDAADADPTIPKDQQTRLKQLRRGLIPWLASIDPDTGVPRRRVARLNDIPADAQPLLKLLVEQRLLSVDVSEKTGETTIEPAHEALLRKWPLLQRWLSEDIGLLSELVSIEHATSAWLANERSDAWLAHRGNRLQIAQTLLARRDLAHRLEQAHHAYIRACRVAELRAKRQSRRTRTTLAALAVVIGLGVVTWWKQEALQKWVFEMTTVRPYVQTNFRPFVLTPESERMLRAGASFRECGALATCPEMLVVPEGEFVMGSTPEEIERLKLEYPVGKGAPQAKAPSQVAEIAGQNHRPAVNAVRAAPSPRHWAESERPQRRVRIERLAISRYEVTFDEWEQCVQLRGCPPAQDSGRGRGSNPVINVNWFEAGQYTAWLSKATGKRYRLVTEAEWEYAARAGTSTRYSWGDEIGTGNANCDGCGSTWDGQRPAPVGSLGPNPFGLHDMHGNVREWVEDTWHADYSENPPVDGSAWTKGGDESQRNVRGGGWFVRPEFARSANRGKQSALNRTTFIGFRVARTLEN